MRIVKATCPMCHGYLEVDADTGKVVAHQASFKKEAKGQDLFEAAKGNVVSRMQTSDERLDKLRGGVAQRQATLKEAFDKAKEKAKDVPEDERPANPMDLD